MTRMTIVKKEELVKDVYEMTLYGDTSQVTCPGQFINIKVTDTMQPYLRRPMSICDWDSHTIKIIFRVVGEGTRILASKKINDTVDCLIGLGNGFCERDVNVALVIGGGLGVPPMYALVKKFLSEGKKVQVVLGFNSQKDIFYQDTFIDLCPTYIATMDGSVGCKGTVIDAIQQNNLYFDKYYACGPEKMLEALVLNYPDNGYLSYETRMGCGIGACMGCSMKVKGRGYKRICKEGPVLQSSEVIING